MPVTPATDDAGSRDAAAEWWRGAIIYQIYPRSFQDTSGNGVGDLAGITRRLAYVAELGVDAVWISPFFVSPMKDFGYDVADYTDVDPLFGTLADFDELVAEAHRLGLKVIIDQVLSHTSDQHAWFRDSRASHHNAKSDWYVWADAKPDGTPPNNWLSVFGGPAWQWDSRRRQYYLHNFLTEQPDLNLHNPAVQEAILAVVEFWLERGVDGFRFDAVNYFFDDAARRDNPPASLGGSEQDLPINPYGFQDHIHDKNRPETVAFLTRVRALLNRYPGTTSVGEIGDGGTFALKLLAQYTSGGDKLHMCYTFDFLGPEFSAAVFRSRIELFETIVNDGWPCWAFSNHDVPRHVSRWARAGLDQDRLARLAAGILLSLRGSVSLYQGEELALTEADIGVADMVDPYSIRFWPEFKGRDGCRTPMVWQAEAPNAGFSIAKPWLPIPPEHVTRAVDRQQVTPGSLLADYRRLIAFRRDHPALTIGSMAFLDGPSDVLAFTRHGGGEHLLCLFNLGSTEARFDLPGAMAVTALAGHVFSGRLDEGGRWVILPPCDGFFGAVG